MSLSCASTRLVAVGELRSVGLFSMTVSLVDMYGVLTSPSLTLLA